jgi:ligand-binding SRPBCC domain-containing protein
MARIELVTEIQAAPGRCFDLSRDLDLHQRSLGHTKEKAISGRTTGLIGMGEEVTWRATHFGFSHTHTARITGYDRPNHFRDEMIKGRFKVFVHDHHFEATETGTRMRDILRFRSPLGPIGAAIDVLVLRRYLRELLETRNEVVRTEAESFGLNQPANKAMKTDAASRRR